MTALARGAIAARGRRPRRGRGGPDLRPRRDPRSCSISRPRSTCATRSRTRPAMPTPTCSGRSRCSRRRARCRARRVVFTSTGGGLYGDADVFPTPGGLADPADGAVRAGQVRRRGLLRPVHPPARSVDGLAALRQRLRAPPGRARRGRRGRDLLRPAGRGQPRRRCSATARQTRDWVEVSDVVRANLLAADSDVDRPDQHRPRSRDVGARPAGGAAARSATAGPLGSPEFAPERPGRGAAQLPGRDPREA